MQHPKLRTGLNVLGWLLSMGLTVSGLVIPPVGYTLLVLMLPVSAWTFWPWIKRIRLRSPFVLAGREGESSPEYPGRVFTPTVTQGDTADAVRRRDREIEQLTGKLRAIEQDNAALRAQLADPTLMRKRREEMARRHCLEVARELTNFLQGYKSASSEQMVIDRFRQRHKDKVDEVRDELDQLGKLVAEERENLTFGADDGTYKIKSMVSTLTSIGMGW